MSEDDRYGFYEVVPPEFNLLHASPDQLDRFGIPQKPDAVAEPSLFEFWKKLVSPPFAAKRPTFGSIHPPLVGGPVDSMLNWSGALVSPPWPKRFVLAVAGWIAPTVSLTSTPALFTPSNAQKSLVWVGIDGHNGMLPNISLPQIGTAHQPGVSHFAWWDWWRHVPKGSPQKPVTRIENLAINAGDEILAGLAVLISEDVLFFIKNQSTGEFRSFLAKRQPLGDIEPLGSSVEWVVERPTDPTSGKLFQLPAYGSVDFKHCVARAADGPIAPGRLMTLADNALIINMRESFADPYRIAHVSRATRRHDPGGATGVTCTFHEPM